MLGCSGGTNNPASTTQPTPTQSESPASSPVSDDPMQNKGIGPVTSLALKPIDSKLVKEGEKAFEQKCTACHKLDKRRVGPPLSGVTARRTPEWIMNMILNPTEMLEKDPIAKELLAEYSTQMANMSLTEAEARAILEYLRTKEESHAKK
ncbi:cytochrome c [bacterium]|nr:cytochrome c [bacterium]